MQSRIPEPRPNYRYLHHLHELQSSKVSLTAPAPIKRSNAGPPSPNTHPASAVQSAVGSKRKREHPRTLIGPNTTTPPHRLQRGFPRYDRLQLDMSPRPPPIIQAPNYGSRSGAARVSYLGATMVFTIVPA